MNHRHHGRAVVVEVELTARLARVFELEAGRREMGVAELLVEAGEVLLAEGRRRELPPRRHRGDGGPPSPARVYGLARVQ